MSNNKRHSPYSKPRRGHLRAEFPLLDKIFRDTIAKDRVYAEVSWNAQFEKFRITKLVSTATPLSPTTRFEQAKAQQARPVKAPQELLITDTE